MNDNKDNIELQIAEHISEIMDLLGIERTQSNADTPKRVAKMWNREIFKNRPSEGSREDLIKQLKMFENTTIYSEPVVIKDIPFYSTCEHHFMPFRGKATIGYIPREKIIGLSKIPRIVEYFSKRPQLQERLCDDIARFMITEVDCACVFVYLHDVEHTCVSARGVEKECSTDTYSAYADLSRISKEEYKIHYNWFRSTYMK